MASLTQARLKELLNYCPDTGQFIWRVTRRVKAGSIAGARHPTQGYIAIKIDGVLYRAHRLAWLYSFGYWPPDDVDHINRIRDDNRLHNLRLATRAQNCQNRRIRTDNKSGYPGVNWHSRDLKWRAYINIRNKNVSLGYFDVLDDAIAARKLAETVYMGDGVC